MQTLVGALVDIASSLVWRGDARQTRSGSRRGCRRASGSAETRTRTEHVRRPPCRAGGRACDSRAVWSCPGHQPCSASSRASPYRPQSPCERSAPECVLTSEDRSARPPLPTRASRTRSARVAGHPPDCLAPLALVVEGDVDREALEVLCGGGFGSPPGVQLCRGRDRRLDRDAALTIRDDLITTPSHLHNLTDRQVEPLHDSCHGPMVAPKGGGRQGRQDAPKVEGGEPQAVDLERILSSDERQ